MSAHPKIDPLAQADPLLDRYLVNLHDGYIMADLSVMERDWTEALGLIHYCPVHSSGEYNAYHITTSATWDQLCAQIPRLKE